MVGAKGKNIFIFLLFAYTIPFQEDIFVRANFSKKTFKKKGGYSWVHKYLIIRVNLQHFIKPFKPKII
jgi:hypothetical protein